MRRAKHDSRRMMHAGHSPAEAAMVCQELWEEIRYTAARQSVSISELARRLGVDRKTIRHCLRESRYRSYQCERPAATLLGEHEAYLRERAPTMDYSAQILYQELRAERGYRGQLRDRQAVREALASGA